ncbi:MAG TPA: tetratricopeptide repeat protein, partial [Anaerolineae bacterium]|nr:tetratricopeptide repeat protein [Anaerolineae bacterium]
GEANTLLALSDLDRAAGQLHEAQNKLHLALETYRIIGDRYSEARALYRLGDCALAEGRAQDAIELYQQAMELWSAIGLEDLVKDILLPRQAEAKTQLQQGGGDWKKKYLKG